MANAAGYNMVYLSFTDWAQASAASHFYLDRSGIGAGYRAAPEVFYFAPQNLWYLVYQDGNAAYSANPDINNPAGWTTPVVRSTRRGLLVFASRKVTVTDLVARFSFCTRSDRAAMSISLPVLS